MPHEYRALLPALTGDCLLSSVVNDPTNFSLPADSHFAEVCDGHDVTEAVSACPQHPTHISEAAWAAIKRVSPPDYDHDARQMWEYSMRQKGTVLVTVEEWEARSEYPDAMRLRHGAMHEQLAIAKKEAKEACSVAQDAIDRHAELVRAVESLQAENARLRRLARCEQHGLAPQRLRPIYRWSPML